MYDFENKDKIPFKDLTGEQMHEVTLSIAQGLTSYYSGDDAGWCLKESGGINLHGIYRVKSAPYTLEDALEDVAALTSPTMCGKCGVTLSSDSAVSIIKKLAASIEASK